MTIADALVGAAPGPAIETELVSLSGHGSLFVAWDPPQLRRILWVVVKEGTLTCGVDGAGFRWMISKLDNGDVTFEPVAMRTGMIFRQQAALTGGDLLLISLGNHEGDFYTLHELESEFVRRADSPMGFPVPTYGVGLAPAAGTDPARRLWLMRNPTPLQSGVQITPPSQIDDQAIAASLAAHGLSADSGLIANARQALVGPAL